MQPRPDEYHPRVVTNPKPHEPTDTTPQSNTRLDMMSTAIVDLLIPVDWASVHTLSRYLGITREAVQAHLSELQHRGAVGIGERFIPPDIRTVAWLTDKERHLRRQS